jgi:hypothetical protein
MPARPISPVAKDGLAVKRRLRPGWRAPLQRPWGAPGHAEGNASFSANRLAFGALTGIGHLVASLPECVSGGIIPKNRVAPQRFPCSP